MDSLRVCIGKNENLKNQSKIKKINQKSKKCNVKYSISDMRDVNETGMNENNAASEVAMVACRVCTRLILNLNTYFLFTHNSITK